jgi:hypothetical protein
MTPSAIVGVPHDKGYIVLPGTVFDWTCKLCGARVGLAPSGQRKREALGLDVFCLTCVAQLLVTSDTQVEGPTAEEIISDIRGEVLN